jgi:hypothetical protein
LDRFETQIRSIGIPNLKLPIRIANDLSWHDELWFIPVYFKKKIMWRFWGGAKRRKITFFATFLV